MMFYEKSGNSRVTAVPISPFAIFNEQCIFIAYSGSAGLLEITTGRLASISQLVLEHCFISLTRWQRPACGDPAL
jgi:hypothetical protein